MNKSKLAVGLMTLFLTGGVLASCDSKETREINKVRYSNDGTILTYTDESGEKTVIKADDLFVDYYSDSSKYQSIFDSIYSIVVRNYFSIEENVTYLGNNLKVGKSQMEQIKIDAQYKVDSDIRTAKKNADNKNTNYKDELEEILSGKGVKDTEELFDKYVEECQKETFDENFYKYHINEIKNGADDVKTKKDGADVNLWTGYFNDMAPYHVSHILVKLEDGSGTNYANGTISEDNAKKLFDVVDALGSGKDSFGTIAYQFSEDPGSAKNYGDLGIMDYSTGYVNEFKLGIYAYENFLGNTDAAMASVIKIPGNEDSSTEGIAENLSDVVMESFEHEEMPVINKSVFEDLKKFSKVTKDQYNDSVLEDAATFYPRNIIYNRYLNRHFFAFITSDTANITLDANGNDTEGKTSGYLASDAGNVLSVKTANGWNPVLCVRAGSDYQGIHFIVVNRSPFDVEADKNGVTLDEYYTTFNPEQDGYPGKKEGQPKATYVNFSSSVQSETKSRADSLKSTVKSYDSDKLNKYIFRKYFELEGLKLSDEKLEDALNMWIDRGLEKKEQDTQDAWEKTWNDYIDTLAKQNTERSKLVSQACKIGYAHANEEIALDLANEIISEMATAMVEAGEAENDTEALAKIKAISGGVEKTAEKLSDIFKMKGGLCNDGKAHL